MIHLERAVSGAPPCVRRHRMHQCTVRHLIIRRANGLHQTSSCVRHRRRHRESGPSRRSRWLVHAASRRRPLRWPFLPPNLRRRPRSQQPLRPVRSLCRLRCAGLLQFLRALPQFPCSTGRASSSCCSPASLRRIACRMAAEAWRVELRTDRPVAADGVRVFIASGEAIHALNAATSEVLWRAPIGTITAPLVAKEGWVIAATDATVTAFRAADGSKVWSRSTGAQRERATIDGDNLYLPLDDGHLLALDLQTGAERWSRHFTGPLSEVLAIGDRIYVGSADKYFYCLNAGNGQWALEGGWRQFIGAALRGRPAADESRACSRRRWTTRCARSIAATARSGGSRACRSGPADRPSSDPRSSCPARRQSSGLSKWRRGVRQVRLRSVRPRSCRPRSRRRVRRRSWPP